MMKLNYKFNSAQSTRILCLHTLPQMGEHISWEGKHIFGHCYRKVELSFHLRFPDFLIFLAGEKLCAGVFMAQTEREKAREMKYLRTNRHTYYILVLAARLPLLIFL